ncbi:MAG: cytochrome b/b6 domain-containing protein, partial [Pseudorhodobacter sp.]
ILFTLVVISLSGYLMTTDMFWGIPWPEQLHEAAVSWAEFSVVVHIAAVIFESLRTKTNLPASMITGNKPYTE